MNMKLYHQISAVVKSCYFYLRKISSIRQYLTQSATETLIHAFISSRLDQCNSLYAHLPKYAINRLQKIQNAASRITLRKSRRTHTSPLLRELHWLPVHSRINFKILLLTHKCIHQTAPLYLQQLITVKTFTRCTRQSHAITLTQPKPRTATYGQRPFSFLAPNLWNTLPANIRNTPQPNTFKSLLKTHLFNV